MQEKLIILLGGSEYQCDILKIIQSYNIKVLVIDRNKKAYCKKFANYFYQYDISSIKNVLAIFKKYKNKFNILNIISSSEYGLAPAHFINNKYINNRALSLEQLDFLISKKKLNKYIDKHILSVKTYNLDKLCNVEFPVIIKPANAMNSLDVCYIDNISDLYVKLKHYYNTYKKEEIIIQPYLEGKSYGLKFIYDNFVVDKVYMQRFFNGYFQPIGGIIPVKLSVDIDKKIVNQIEKIFFCNYNNRLKQLVHFLYIQDK